VALFCTSATERAMPGGCRKCRECRPRLRYHRQSAHTDRLPACTPSRPAAFMQRQCRPRIWRRFTRRGVASVAACACAPMEARAVQRRQRAASALHPYDALITECRCRFCCRKDSERRAASSPFSSLLPSYPSWSARPMLVSLPFRRQQRTQPPADALHSATLLESAVTENVQRSRRQPDAEAVRS